MTVLTFDLHLLEPVLVTAPGGDPNTDSSLAYIPGSAIRGALAARYLRDHAADDTFTDLFLNGRARYLNAYPKAAGQRALPSPRAWVREKDATTDADRVYDLAYPADAIEFDKRLPQRFDAPFAITVGSEIRPAGLDYEIAIHTARNREKGRAIEDDETDASAVFRYRALARDQRFAGAVLVDDDALAETLLALLQGDCLLGGSQTAGYGLTAIDAVQPVDGHDWREVDSTRPDLPPGEAFVIVLTAHAILRDPEGRPTTDIRHALPGGAASYDPPQGFAAAEWVGGFNRTWGLPLPQEWATRPGSAWRLQAKRALSAVDIAALEWSGVGGRTAEGFGRLLVLTDRVSASLSAPKPEAATAQGPAPRYPALQGDAGILATQMRRRIALHELDKMLVAAAQELHFSGRPSNSQLGRLRLRIGREKGTRDFQAFRTYLHDTFGRKSADDQFRKFFAIESNGKGETHNVRKWLLELTEHSSRIWDHIIREPDWQPPALGTESFAFRADEALSRDYTIRFISALCDYAAKNRPRRNMP